VRAATQCLGAAISTTERAEHNTTASEYVKIERSLGWAKMAIHCHIAGWAWAGLNPPYFVYYRRFRRCCEIGPWSKR